MYVWHRTLLAVLGGIGAGRVEIFIGTSNCNADRQGRPGAQELNLCSPPSSAHLSPLEKQVA